MNFLLGVSISKSLMFYYLWRMIKWKRIPNFNKYECSNNGLIKTFNWKNTGKTKIMKPCKTQGYYKTMLIDDDGNYKTISVHRVVAQTWIPNPENKPQVNHIDANTENNHVSNLEWCTLHENIQHAIDNNLMVSHIGEKNGWSKLTEKQVIEIRSKFKPRIYTRQMLADEYNVKPSCIKDIILRKSWKHLN